MEGVGGVWGVWRTFSAYRAVRRIKVWAYSDFMLYKLPRGHWLVGGLAEMMLETAPRAMAQCSRDAVPDRHYVGSNPVGCREKGGWCVRPTPRRQEAGA